mmetsp:Transcript_6071/g.20722  ORF Transcript_6071/g.20722 Transcript_6071/m.20722 type:complete len:345 (-) Transcript_6071:41-1075(-)
MHPWERTRSPGGGPSSAPPWTAPPASSRPSSALATATRPTSRSARWPSPRSTWRTLWPTRRTPPSGASAPGIRPSRRGSSLPRGARPSSLRAGSTLAARLMSAPTRRGPSRGWRSPPCAAQTTSGGRSPRRQAAPEGAPQAGTRPTAPPRSRSRASKSSSCRRWPPWRAARGSRTWSPLWCSPTGGAPWSCTAGCRAPSAGARRAPCPSRPPPSRGARRLSRPPARGPSSCSRWTSATASPSRSACAWPGTTRRTSTLPPSGSSTTTSRRSTTTTSRRSRATSARWLRLCCRPWPTSRTPSRPSCDLRRGAGGRSSAPRRARQEQRAAPRDSVGRVRPVAIDEC